MNAVLVTMYAALMHLVLFDRFLEIYLHLRYEIVCTVNRTKVLIVAIFVLLVLSAIPQMVLMEKDFVVIFLFYSSYVWPSISITFLISSISIYAYIYIKVSQFRETTRINHKLGQFSMSTRFETSTRATTNNKSTSNKRHSPLPVTSAPLVRDNGDLGITESKIALEPRSPLIKEQTRISRNMNINISSETNQNKSWLSFIQSATPEGKDKLDVVNDTKNVSKYFVEPLVGDSQDVTGNNNELHWNQDHHNEESVEPSFDGVVTQLLAQFPFQIVNNNAESGDCEIIQQKDCIRPKSSNPAKCSFQKTKIGIADNKEFRNNSIDTADNHNVARDHHISKTCKSNNNESTETGTSSKYIQESKTSLPKTESNTGTATNTKPITSPVIATEPQKMNNPREIKIAEEQKKLNRLRTKKRMFLPTLLIGSFIIFWVLPVLYMFSRHMCRSGLATNPEYVVTNSFVGLGVCFDAFAYIFTYKSVRKYLTKKLRSIKRTDRVSSI